jgi:hypothetical protein
MNAELFTRLFAQFNNPPPITTEDDPEGGTMLVIGGSPFVITSYSHKVNTPLAERTVNRYTLAAMTEDDFFELHKDTDLVKIAVKAAGEYAEWRARNAHDALCWDNYAKDIEADRQALKDAHDAGKAYFNGTPAHQRDRSANPYPFGIQHYDEWRRGYNTAENESVF